MKPDWLLLILVVLMGGFSVCFLAVFIAAVRDAMGGTWAMLSTIHKVLFVIAGAGFGLCSIVIWWGAVALSQWVYA